LQIAECQCVTVNGATPETKVQTDFKRRVERNTVLRPKDALSPLFEAVTNAVDAIQEAAETNGRISIEIERGQAGQQQLFSLPIRSFVIRDNGVGVTEDNYRAFETDSTGHKEEIGGKGVGRFLWLKAFDHAEVTSVFLGDRQKLVRRTFKLCLSERGIEDHAVAEIDRGQRGTEVRLCDYKEEFQKEVPATSEVICKRLVEYFLQYFVLGTMPPLFVHDHSGDENYDYDLWDVFSNNVDKARAKQDSFDLSGHLITVDHFLVSHSFQNAHRLYFCADKKMVTSKPLSARIPNLPSASLRANDGTPLMYAGYVSGDYLDRANNTERTSIDLPDEDSSQGPGWETLLGRTIETSSTFLEPYTQPIREAKNERIRVLTQTHSPQYRPVVKHRPDLIDTIPPNVTEDKLDQELYRVAQIYDSDLRSRAAELLAQSPSPEEWEKFKERYGQFLEEWNESGVAKLAKHVVHRKATIDFFKAMIRKIPETGKYHLEDAIHGLIFPLHNTSDDLPPDKMNLWIIDEKLSYHYYLASNLTFKQQAPVSISGGKKPDITIYHNQSALVNEEQPFSSVTILEFKRPQRDDYSEEDNPIVQVFEYADKLRSGRALDRNARPINIRPHTPIYAYILCDPAPSLERYARYHQLGPTPDGSGYFGYNPRVEVWVEVITFDKLIQDAEKRNMTLFDQLNIPR
jgi:hypothetical protein